jgi:hypothetical protein
MLTNNHSPCICVVRGLTFLEVQISRRSATQGRSRGLANEKRIPEICRARARRCGEDPRRIFCKSASLLEADANDDDGPTSKKRRTTRPAATGGDTSLNVKGSKGKRKKSTGKTTVIKIQPRNCSGPLL